jgi:ribosomal peptide maturation radical SAM protein 1
MRELTLLIGMPWDLLRYPSIALGTLKSILEREGLTSEVLPLNLAWMDFLCGEHWGDARGFQLSDYGEVSRSVLGIGNWIFAIPPYHELRPDDDERYFSYLRSAGIDDDTLAKAARMRELAPVFLERCVEEILRKAPRAVGFTSSFVQNVPALILARLLKDRDPSLAVIFGGSNCDGPMGEALHRSFPWVDVVVRGEGERVLPELLRDLFAGGPIRHQPGLCLRENGTSVVVEQSADTVPMDEVPAPSYDEYFERLERCSFRAELKPDVVLHIETARGCWWGQKSHCTFCGLNGSTMAFRSKSPERVLDELTRLAKKHRHLDFAAVDNILDPKYLRSVLPRITEQGLDLRLFFEAKANLKKAEIRVLRDAGVRHIQPGIESLSTPILRLMKKGVTALQNIRLLKWCAQYGIRTSWNLIYGFPGEPEAEYMAMARLFPALSHLEPPGVSPLVLDRFSPYHQHPGEHGLEIVGPSFPYRFFYRADERTMNDLAYSFQFRYLDGRTPAVYAAPAVEAAGRWVRAHAHDAGALRLRRGPGFVRIEDRRTLMDDQGDYVLDEVEARVYLACEAGVTAATAWKLAGGAQANLDVEDVEQFLDELVAARLVFEENGRYLSLAIPTDPDMDDAADSVPEEQRLREPSLVSLRRSSEGTASA